MKNDLRETRSRLASSDLSRGIWVFGESGWRKGISFLPDAFVSFDGVMVRREKEFKQQKACIDRRYRSTT
jgi:hypothetical protein